jgi:hypothetical protein
LSIPSQRSAIVGARAVTGRRDVAARRRAGLDRARAAPVPIRVRIPVGLGLLVDRLVAVVVLGVATLGRAGVGDRLAVVAVARQRRPAVRRLAREDVPARRVAEAVAVGVDVVPEAHAALVELAVAVLVSAAARIGDTGPDRGVAVVAVAAARHPHRLGIAALMAGSPESPKPSPSRSRYH